MTSVRRAKIVCTLGPATATPERILGLVEAGMDVARLNLSHGTHADHARIYRMVRDASDVTQHSVGVLVDLQGPKIRLGTFADGPVTLSPGSTFTITTEDVPGTEHRVATTYQGLPQDVRSGDRILIDDGQIALEVTQVAGAEIHTRVLVGGRVSDHKGLNVPGAALAVPALTDKDADDLRFALSLRADLVALSFVRSPADIEPVHAVMDEVGVRLPVLAKLEKPQAVSALDEVLEAFDGLMVARGDLGVELPLEDVPLVQKRAVAAARSRAKPVIVATQVLDSMTSSPRPTRAEVSDCANAILDGTDAVMLSGETSVGRYPIETVQTMARIVSVTEQQGCAQLPPVAPTTITRGGAIASAAATVGTLVGARYLVAFTQTGDTARRLARSRCSIPLLAFTPTPVVRSQLSLVWGVETFLAPVVAHTDDMVRQVDRLLLDIGRCQPGDLVVVVAGSPPQTPGSTNTLRVHQVGELT
jgi:pyruvate kinase